MLRIIQISIIISPLFIVMSCGFRGGYSGANPRGTGPFDARGNYIEQWADNPSKWGGRSISWPSRDLNPAPSNKPNPSPPPRMAQSTPPSTQKRPSTTQTVVAQKTTPSVTKPKPKPKPKPAFVYHTVVRGDTLFGLSRKYKVPASKIQQANGMKNTVVVLGKRLKIPNN